MTGAEHYRRAELLLESCVAREEGEEHNEAEVTEYYGPALDPVSSTDDCRNALMAAQIHATLALAAATALGVDNPAREWREVAARASQPERNGGNDG